MNDQREKFEAWIDARHMSIMRTKEGRYIATYTQMAWEAWREALAQRDAALPISPGKEDE